MRERGVGVAIIGCGMMGTLRARVIAMEKSVDFLVVCDTDRDRARELGERVGADLVVESAEEALRHPRVEAVVVSTRAGSHHDIAAEAIAQGRTTMVEKPFCADLAQAESLVDQAGRATVPLFVGYSQRFREKFRSSRHLVEQEQIGRVTSVVGTFYTTRLFAERGIARSPRGIPPMTVFHHIADLCMWHLQGRALKRLTARASRGEVGGTAGVPLSFWVTLEFRDDSLCTVGASAALPSSFPAYHASMGLHVFGTRGAIMIDDGHSDFVVSAERPFTALDAPYTSVAELRTVYAGTFPPGDGSFGLVWGCIRDETSAFVQAVRSGEHPVLATGDDGLTVRRLVSMVEESLSSDASVSP